MYGRKDAQVQVWLEGCTGPGMKGRKEAKAPGALRKGGKGSRYMQYGRVLAIQVNR
jgi:hypothetical protein